MNRQSKFSHIKKIKTYLVFFCVLLYFNCKKSTEESKSIVKIETNNIKSISFDSKSRLEDLSIVLKNHSNMPIIGDWLNDANRYTFTPFLPFTEGETYQILDKGEAIHFFSIKTELPNLQTELLAIYPTTDSVPENLLKMYFVFSEPMQEIENSLDYIRIYDNTSQQDVSVFLELQPELWNKEHTVLTLWLDPGRIKTDLIPNQEMGLPLNSGHNYTINIDNNWKDANGNPIAKSYSKKLIVGPRDNEYPKADQWIIKKPKYNSKEPLVINFNEPIDYFLAMESIDILDATNNTIHGHYVLEKKESFFKFYPESEWQKEIYTVSIESRLEDLAGNNLNYLFDTDLNKEHSTGKDTKIKSIKFVVE